MGIDISNPQTQALVSLIVSVITALGGIYALIKNSRKTEAETESSLSETAMALLAPYKKEVEELRAELKNCREEMERKFAEETSRYKKQVNSLRARIRELEKA